MKRLGPRTRGLQIAAFSTIAVLAFIVVLSAFVALPGERTVKGWFGVVYSPTGCGSTRDRGTPGHWQTQAPLGEARDEVRAVRVGDAAYLVGGAAKRGSKVETVRTFERYDLRTGERTTLPALPTPLNHTGVAAYRADIYVVGGAGNDLEHATNRFWRYSTRDRRWTALPPMPTARTAFGVAVSGGRLYAVGGKNNRVSRSTAEAYDFATRRWSELAPLPTRRDHISVAAYDGAIYAAGGRNEKQGVLQEFDRYDPRSGRWTRLADVPMKTSGSSLLGTGIGLVVAGGENPPERYMTARVVDFDIKAGRWSNLPAMDHPRHGYASVAKGDRVFLFGGSRCPGQNAPVNAVDSLKVAPAGGT